MYVHKYSAFIHIYIYDLYLFGGVNWLLGTSQPWATYPMHFIFLYIRIRYHYISIKYNIIKHIIEYNVMYNILHIFTYIYIKYLPMKYVGQYPMIPYIAAEIPNFQKVAA